MGLLVNGSWKDEWYDTESTGGRFVRKESAFRDWITPDGSSGFPAEPCRYHLYVSHACPWAHRAVIFRRLKNLEPLIGLSVVDPLMLENGWEFSEEPGCIPDTLYGAKFLYEIYVKADPDYTGRVTVPVLWDKQKETIVNNESSEIIRMFNRSFDEHVGTETDFCPEEQVAEIDTINAFVLEHINNGVYKCGFATEQDPYEEAFENLFTALDEVNTRLTGQRYLVGNRITEADWRLFTTLVRFDAVYYNHFKCNQRRIAEYPALSGYLRELYQVPGIVETVHFDHIKQHYFSSHRQINPTGIVPRGPVLGLEAPHGRERL